MNAGLSLAAAEYQHALAELVIPYGPGKCAPAIGVHVMCEHDR